MLFWQDSPTFNSFMAKGNSATEFPNSGAKGFFELTEDASDIILSVAI